MSIFGKFPIGTAAARLLSQPITRGEKSFIVSPREAAGPFPTEDDPIDAPADPVHKSKPQRQQRKRGRR